MKNQTHNRFSHYYWRGINRRGKRIAGKMLALNSHEVRERLNERAIQLTQLKARKIPFIYQVTQRTTSKDITLLTRQLSTMIGSGVSIVHALKLIAQNHHKAETRSILRQITKSVESGSALAMSFRESSSLFEPLYTDLVATGEQSGNLAQVFQRIAEYREGSEQLRAKVMKALIYPTMVILTAFFVSYLMLTMVIPEFETMFMGFGVELPWFTQQVLSLSNLATSYAGTGLVICALALFSLKRIHTHSYAARLMFSRLTLHIPLIGQILTKASVARFSRTLATSFAAGVPILEGVKSAAKVTPNLHYQAAIVQAQKDINAGVPLFLAISNNATFPEMVPQMIMIGEESGKLDEMLHRIADIYEAEIENTVDNLGKIIEPMIILILGTIVGGLVVAMYLPIFNLMSVLG